MNDDDSQDSLNILLVEDDADHAHLIRRYIRVANEQATLTWVQSLSAAREACNDHEFDAILLDLNLPDSSIQQTMSSVIGWAGGAPVVVLTALDDLETGIRAINEGAQDYLVKQELTPNYLSRSLRYAIERARSQRQLHELTVQLQRANIELESFSSIVVHDLRSPVGRLKWFVEMMQRDEQSQLSTSAREYLEVIDSQAERIGTLISDLWTYAQRGENETPSDFDAAELCGDLFEMLDRPDSFRLILDPESCLITTQRTALEVVLRNLIQNAIKHHDHAVAGVVTVECQPGEGQIEFVIRDNGPGLPTTVVQHFRNAASESKRFDDSPLGLGLVVVRRIVERRGGRITAAVTDEGSEFRVLWPEALQTAPVETRESGEFEAN